MSKACLDWLVGLTMPKPPSLAGRLSRSRSTFEHGGLPVNAGMKDHSQVEVGGHRYLG